VNLCAAQRESPPTNARKKRNKALRMSAHPPLRMHEKNEIRPCR
jgi:hypothetical protein